MTDISLETGTQHWWRDRSEETRNTIVAAVPALIAITYIVVQGFMSRSSAEELSELSSSSTILISGWITLIPVAMVSIFALCFRGVRSFWEWLNEETGVDGFWWWMWLPGVVLASFLAVAFILPNSVATPMTHYRLTYDGQLVSPGQKVEAPRFRRWSTPVALSYRDVTFSLPVRTPEGTITLTGTMDVWLEEGLTTESAILDHSMQLHANPLYFRKLAARYLQENSMIVVDQLRQGSGAHPTVLLTQAVASGKVPRPDWLRAVTMSDVEVKRGSYRF